MKTELKSEVETKASIVLLFTELAKEIFKIARLRLRKQFDFSEDHADEEELTENVKKSMSLQGANLWVLIFAIFIASVGLNINSTAVIIGAMLISPLMGPITGIGFGAAILDFKMVRSSLRTLTMAIITSVVTSTIYFSISPLNQANSELLARTSPTFYDVLIAFFGGLAVTIASTRKNKSANVIAGASIATALMPPLCTAGYSLAHHNASFFFGAFYLFFINCIYICLATYLITRMLGLKQIETNNPIWNKYLPRTIAALAILTLIPSVYFGYRLVQSEFMQEKIEAFIQSEILEKDIQLLQQKLEKKDGKYFLKLVLLGDHKKSVEKDLATRLAFFGLSEVELKLEDTLIDKPIADLSQLKTGVLEELFVKNEKIIKLKEDEIATLKTQLSAIEAELVIEEEILAELIIEHPEINNLVLQRKKNKLDEYDLLGYVESQASLAEQEQARIRDWLRVRTKSHSIHINFTKLAQI